MARPKTAPGVVPRYRRITEAEKEKFLEVLRETCNIRHAASIIGRSYWFIWQLRKRDAKFDTAMKEAHDEAIAKLEGVVYQGATVGYEEEVYYQGKFVGKKRVISERWAEFLLIANRPEKYAVTKIKHEMTGKDGTPLIPQAVDVIDTARRVAYLLTMAATASLPTTPPVLTLTAEPEPETVH